MTEELFPRGFAKAGRYSVHECIYNVMWIMKYCPMHEERCNVCVKPIVTGFRYASPCLWNQHPSSLRQPHSSPSVSDFPAHAPATSYSLSLPLSPSITLSFTPGLRPIFSQIFPIIDSLPASGLTPRLYDWSVSSEHLGFYF